MFKVVVIKEVTVIFFAFIFLLFSPAGCAVEKINNNSMVKNESGSLGNISLPQPEVKGQVSLEEALYARISRRNFGEKGLNLFEVSQLLWAAGGVGVDGLTGASRTAPSAGGIYPLELYLVVGEVEDMNKGVYYYDYKAHSLIMKQDKDVRGELARAALGQQMVASAPAVIVMAAHIEKTTARYGERGNRYVYLDAGYISQNIYLQAEALNMATVAVGAFNDDTVKEIIQTEGAPVMIMPIGYAN